MNLLPLLSFTLMSMNLIIPTALAAPRDASILIPKDLRYAKCGEPCVPGRYSCEEPCGCHHIRLACRDFAGRKSSFVLLFLVPE